MKKELLEKKKRLMEEIDSIDKQLEGAQKMKDELERLQEFTDSLNTMFQDPVVEYHSQEASNLLYDAMQILDKIMVSLEEEIKDIESED
jgi:cell division septum initiation protein DivIVA